MKPKSSENNEQDDLVWIPYAIGPKVWSGFYMPRELAEQWREEGILGFKD